MCAPSGTTTFLSRIAPRTTACRPTWTPCMSTDASTCAHECTWTPGESTERFTDDPETTDPGDSRLSRAVPTRPAEPCTVRAGGQASWSVKIGQARLDR